MTDSSLTRFSSDASVPLVLVVSDSLGDTARGVVAAAAGQFPDAAFRIERLSKVRSTAQIADKIGRAREAGTRVAVFYTVVEPRLRADIAALLETSSVPAVDLMGPATSALSALSGLAPAGTPGVIHRTDASYFDRIEAMEYFVAHDDGRGADDLSGADIVLIGVSRTSKTPLSMYLAFQGYKVANIPLAPGMEPPRSLFDVEPGRLFGLVSTVDVIAGIRDTRLGDAMSRARASSYADPVAIARELDEARALMRRLGCLVVRTDGKAIEESAAEIVSQLQALSLDPHGATGRI